ncbi:extracellular calcium-sensing receptor [Pangasianodon hypophthalmus]|uniref:extracellular calcium-sensing receptor n=1 Tax=Pangasianodon hypophthalmus TaxID=310915 RepID=UPI002307A94D|nr:extracellular calcium-sensing receptor [Pangasianodon hypophthalmus]
MLVFHVLALLLSLLWPTCTSSEADCQHLQDLDSAVVHKDGQVILAAMFPIHSKGVEQELNFMSTPDKRKCRGLNLRALRWSQAMIFFIDEINRNPLLLPNITLGYRIYDTCWTVALSARTALSVVSQPLKRNSTGACSSPGIPLVIGDSGSSLSIAVSRLLNLFKVPLISYFASCACLSDKKQHPYFFRTIPSDTYQASAMARLVKHFDWTWVGTFGADDAYGRTGIDMFTAEVTHLGACVAFRVIIPKVPTQQQIQDIVKMIRDSSARVLVTFATEEDMEPVLEEVVRQNVTGRLWVASEAWVTSTLISNKYPFLSGTMGFAIRRAEIPGLKDFLHSLQPFTEPYNPSAREFWETEFQCSFNTSVPVGSMADQVQYNRTCTGKERIQDTETIYNDVSQLRVTYNLHKAVYAAAHALHNLVMCQKQESSTEKQLCPDIYSLQPWQVIKYLKEVNFTNMFGDTVNFDKYGDPAGSYDIVNWQKGPGGRPMQFATVGRFDSSLPAKQQLILYQDDIMWPGGSKELPVSVCSASCQPGYRKAPRKGEPICCYDCVPCAEGSISNGIDQPECTLCPEDLWSNPQRDSCVDKQIEFLSYTEGFGMALAATSILGVAATVTVAVIFIRHRDTPLVRANNSELSFLLLISLSLCFLCALTFLGQPSRWACPLRRTAFGLTFALCLSCLLSKTLVVLMAFRATLPGNNAARWFRPPQQRFGVFLCSAIQCAVCVAWLTTSPPYPVKNTWLYRDRIILECHLGSVALFCCVLGYIGCMAAFCFILAFLARKLPDNFNEAKFITFSMLIFCAVWIAYIPAYVSSPGKFTVAVEIFAILASSFGVLLCIFAPKCYIIIFMPEKNTKKYLMSQKGGR